MFGLFRQSFLTAKASATAVNDGGWCGQGEFKAPLYPIRTQRG